MCPWVGSHSPSYQRQLWKAAQQCGVSLTTGGIARANLRYDRLSLWLELRGPAAWQAAPFWAVCRHACHWLLPWLQVTFAKVPDAARPGSDQWPWSTAPATGPAGQLGSRSASDLLAVVCCTLSLCCSRCVCRLRMRCPGPLGTCSPVRPP